LLPVMDRAFAQVENGSTTAIAKGSSCVWDLTANAAAPGILQDTFGLRVTIMGTGYTAALLFNKAGFAAVDMPGTQAATRGAIYPLQVYGPCNFILVDTTAQGNAVAGSIMVQSTDTAGKVSGVETEGTPTVPEKDHALGFFRDIVAAATNSGTITGFIKCWDIG